MKLKDFDQNLAALYLESLSESDVVKVIAALRSTSDKAAKLDNLISREGWQAGITQFVYELAVETLKKGSQIDLREYLWFRHWVTSRSVNDSEADASLWLIEEELLADRWHPESQDFLAAAWSVVFVARACAHFV